MKLKEIEVISSQGVASFSIIKRILHLYFKLDTNAGFFYGDFSSDIVLKLKILEIQH